MKIKIESGAKVQITDKQIVNNIVYGDVVQQKEVSLPKEEQDTERDSGFLNDIMDRVESGKTVGWKDVTSNYTDLKSMQEVIKLCSSQSVAENVISCILKQRESDIEYCLRKELGDRFSSNWKSDPEQAGPLWDLYDELQIMLECRPDFKKRTADINIVDSPQLPNVTDSQVEKTKVNIIDSTKEDNFINRVKTIMRQVSTKNGQRIVSNARGHEGSYTFNVDANAFCKAIDEMANVYPEKLKELIGGSIATVQVTKVCFFIGNIIRMHVINDENLQMADIQFAFEDYYSNALTVKTKLSDKTITDDQKVILGTFEGLLKKYKR